MTPSRTSKRKAISIPLSALGVIILIATIAGFIPNIQFCDVASHFRLVYIAILGLILVPLLMVRSTFGILIVAVGFVINSVPIILASLPRACLCADNSQMVSILNYNSEFQVNNRVDLLRKEIEKKQPDIIALVEINQRWIDELQPSIEVYKHRKSAIDGPGLALLSKFPIERAEVNHYGKSNHPRIIATLLVGNQHLNVIVVHPTTPKPSGFLERNQELKLVTEEAKSLASPKMVIGDLNCTQFSPVFKQFAAAGLDDSSQGAGLQPTWPARVGRVIPFVPIPPVVPIDHLLVSKDICVVKREVGPPIASDHLPVFLTIKMAK